MLQFGTPLINISCSIFLILLKLSEVNSCIKIILYLINLQKIDLLRDSNGDQFYHNRIGENE